MEAKLHMILHLKEKKNQIKKLVGNRLDLIQILEILKKQKNFNISLLAKQILIHYACLNGKNGICISAKYKITLKIRFHAKDVEQQRH